MCLINLLTESVRLLIGDVTRVWFVVVDEMTRRTLNTAVVIPDKDTRHQYLHRRRRRRGTEDRP